MKLAKLVLEGFNFEAGDTTPDEDDFHYHKTNMDFKGNGKTLETLPKGHDEHVHEIKDGKVVESGHGHTHEIGA